ncbi:MAG: UDP-3-O-(3-hydroxymyristoyl)glucosamine N-acyltransferase [Candidatus Glassbacteria bacterium]
MRTSYTLADIADLIKGELKGDPHKKITGVNTIEDANENEIVYLKDRRYLKKLEESKAAAVVISKSQKCRHMDTISVDRPRLAFIKVVSLFHPSVPSTKPGIHKTAVISESATVGERVSIGAYAVVGDGVRLGRGVVVGSFCYIGDGVEIGDECHLYPAVIIREEVKIGNRCIIHPGAILGSDGFGFETDDSGRQQKIPQAGKLIVEDEVEIGANVSIDRAALGTTVIGKGAKLDNLVHIAHNVKIGEDSILCAQVGIAGSTRIGKGAVLAGQAGLVDHLEIGDRVRIGAQAGVTKSVKDNETISGYPARPHKIAMKREAMLSRLDKMYGLVKELKRRVEKLEREIADEKEGRERDR